MREPGVARGVRPPLKWAGGKRWMLPALEPLWAPHCQRRLVEPFCGGLGVALGLMPKRALLNDNNPHVINFYTWLQRGLPMALEMRNDEARYYRHRERFNDLLEAGAADTAEAAGLFYYLNRTGYNGLCRFNSRGGFNVPFGRYETIDYKRDFSAYVCAFAGWRFTSLDFEKTPAAPDDFIYADPPYDVEFTHYTKDGFGWDEQVRAAQWLSKHRGPVVLSNQATPRIRQLYGDLGFTVRLLAAPRRISCNGDRKPATEVLAVRNLTLPL
jgi:DNA adenine methylase